MPSNRKIYWTLAVLLLFSAAIRAFIAGFIELGNDEVYYWTYARFPALSHFDHPPMVGLVIQLFTLNLRFDSELFLRLASVVLGTASTFIMFLIGRKIKDPLTGLYAAFLFTSSFYGFILSGTFILPDTPQVFFWLLTLYLLVLSLPDRDLAKKSRNLLFIAGITAGFALLSKYHSVFLLAGVFMYLLIYNRKWFRVKETYGALLVAVILFLPVVFWNADNDFISFTFHENRVGISESGLQLQYFATEIMGQVVYNNPVNVIIIVIALVALIRKRQFIEASYKRLILWISLPLLLVFLGFSLFRSTLPHWTGPAYLGLILIAAAYLADTGNSSPKRRLIPWPVAVALIILLSFITVSIGQIQYGWIPLKRMKIDDVTTDLYGWKQLGEKFAVVSAWDENHYLIDQGSPLLTFRWFPAANYDYYVARHLNRKVYCLGELERVHKYYWINKERGNLIRGDDAWYIALSDDYEDPYMLYGKLFDLILPSDTISIIRGHDTIRKAFIYRLIDLKQEMLFVPNSAKTPPVPPQRDTLLFFLKQIRSDEVWMKLLQKKALSTGISLDTVIREEAVKLKNQAKELLKVPDTAELKQQNSQTDSAR